MDTKEIFMKIAEFLEKTGIKEALKNQNVVETIYDVMSKHGMKVDKMMFNLVVMGIANTPADKLGDIVGLVGNMLAGGAASMAGTAQGQGGAAANPLAAILGAVAQGATQSEAKGQQQQSSAQGDAVNPLAALGALGALAGAFGGAAQGQAGQAQQSQAQTQAPPNAADILGGLAKALSQK